MSDTASVKLEAGWAVIRLPEADRDQLLADLAPCPCCSNKSAATAEERDWLREQLSELPVRFPLHRIHGLRVALNSCPCTGPIHGRRRIRYHEASIDHPSGCGCGSLDPHGAAGLAKRSAARRCYRQAERQERDRRVQPCFRHAPNPARAIHHLVAHHP